MPPNVYIATLAKSLAEGGSETEFYVSTIKTLTNEIVTTAQFATLGRGVMTVEPLSSGNIEFCSFTGVDSTGIGFTGGIRGLSALSNLTVAANAKYHPVGAQVIIAFGVHNLLDLKAYIDGAVGGGLGTATDLTSGSTKMTEGMGSLPRAVAALISQQSSPNMTLKVNAFSYVTADSINVSFAGGNTGTITAPVSNPRYDLVVYSTVSLAIAVRTGTEGSSPSLPAPTAGDIVLCSVYNRAGETSLKERDDSTNGYIAQWYIIGKYNNVTGLTLQGSTFGMDQNQVTENGTQAVGKSNTTGNPSIVAQKFIPTVTSIQGVKLWKIADTGTFTGSVIISVQADSAGSPSGTALASYTISNTAWLTMSAAAEFGVAFTSEYESLVPGNTYWIVIAPSTSDSSNHPNIGLNTAGGYASGALKYNNSTDGWVLVATSMLYFKTMTGVIRHNVVTDSLGLIPYFTRPYTFVAVDKTQATIASSTTETVLYTTPIPGGFFNTKSGFKMRLCFKLGSSTTSGATSTMNLKYNGTNILSVSFLSASGAETETYVIDIFVVNSGSLSTQNYQYMGLNGSSDSTVASPVAGSGTATADTSSPCNLEITGVNQNSSSATFVTYNWSSLEKIG